MDLLLVAVGLWLGGLLSANYFGGISIVLHLFVVRNTIAAATSLTNIHTEGEEIPTYCHSCGGVGGGVGDGDGDFSRPQLDRDGTTSLLGNSLIDRMVQDYVEYQDLKRQEEAWLKPTYKVLEPMLRSHPPKLCTSDERTNIYGYSDLAALRLAIDEANRRDAESVVLLDEYDRVYERYMQDPDRHKEPIPPVISVPSAYVICPGAILRSRRVMQPIEINAAEVTIVCSSCHVEGPGTHLTFGSRARGVLIKGVTFKGATTSSLVFPHHGADVSFEDSFFDNNLGNSANNTGAIADLNSTSSVSFYRCEISDTKQMTMQVAGGQQQVSSSLTIRN
eukprot:CAMPEP_0197721482 /NCGR_PEP_ID=MMETSP1434-20131217/4510_1 /TAXON_ID=265543 /ORGANISM="Minutocellus polymorphus, Strain CCMP3303" /LENGTH=334 /DNA_ID=CAMNT_0043306493 /DNA_START=101 /DNA_END=1105 /DNA_ORIENTATION=-